MTYFSAPGLPYIMSKQVTHHRSQNIVQAVCRYFNITLPHLQKKTRLRSVLEKRQILIYLLKKHTSLTQLQIAIIAAKDRTTVIHANQRVKDYLETEPQMRITIAEIEELF